MMLSECKYVKRWHYSRFYVRNDIFIKADWQSKAMGNCLQREGFRLFVYKLSA